VSSARCIKRVESLVRSNGLYPSYTVYIQVCCLCLVSSITLETFKGLSTKQWYVHWLGHQCRGVLESSYQGTCILKQSRQMDASDAAKSGMYETHKTKRPLKTVDQGIRAPLGPVWPAVNAHCQKASVSHTTSSTIA
jgi:hypothetical protein